MSGQYHCVLLTASTLALLMLTGSAAAQFSPYGNRPGANPYQRQTLSPYLNLLRGGNIAANYYLGVLPDVQQRTLNAQFGTAIRDLEQRTGERPGATADELLPTLPSTGHGAAFMNTGGYFPLAVPSRGSPTPPSALQRGRR